MPQRFTEFLGSKDVVLPLVAKDKWEAIDALMAHVAARHGMASSEAGARRELVLARERSMPTGMERGNATPHAAVDGLDRPVGALGFVKDPAGLPFDSIDAQPTNFVVLLLIPRDQKLQHIRTLADIARLLSRDDVRKGLLESEDGAEAWRVVDCAEVENR
ncbi:MAG: PTS sugar transporter subunit IIA [Planctomycetota bacterium]